MRKGMGRNTHYLYADDQKPLSGKEYPLEKTVSAITDRDGNKDYAEPYFQVKKALNEYGGAKPISEGASFDTVLFMTFQYECSGTTGFLGGGKPKCGKNTKNKQIHRLETFELPVKQTKWEKNVLNPSSSHFLYNRFPTYRIFRLSRFTCNAVLYRSITLMQELL